tara:strand:- start:1892 stop:2473 length:582 start_codon:yes stop_codon:yes gene_type:complete
MDQFYKQFFYAVKAFNNELFVENKLKFDQIDYLRDFPFYTENDRWFRYLRDQALGPMIYAKLMDQLMFEKKFDCDGIINNIWFSESNVKEIADSGHVIGLHSYSHPTQMSKLNYDDQFNEYVKNYEHLKGLIGDVYCMSHPCGDYNSDTLDILDYLGIKMGFNSSLSNGKVKSRFEIPRDDHANIFRLMQRCG